ncbi:hypothetical protein L249_6907 [Ophiocordyceps polyrhachis-furcata BCC 54312]|uniref:Uncharacterized protein n=1 Tax=Ophiocordyceps polyrhachis-furcata BCC 54312 TaxID=1330021 RepID=A0A367LLG3_9HYPO|nr:hypothetical protein L249_6907 [Ophiocordyceps polyrhachis-furcata BCC 54312]
MPFVGEGRNINGIFHPDRKRRRDGTASEADARLYRLYSSERLGQDRRMTKRVRGDDDDENDEMTDVRRRRPSQQQNKPDLYHHQHISRFPTTTTTTAAAAAAAAAAVLLMPCHVCHRRPTKKSDLDSFAKCQGCQRRTCFVCIRECHGWLPEPPPPPQTSASEAVSFSMDDDDDDEDDEDDDISPPNHNNQQQPSPPPLHVDDEDDEDDDVADDDAGWNSWGHRAVVCSRCCVERGREGDVVCLGCLAGMAGA